MWRHVRHCDELLRLGRGAKVEFVARRRVGSPMTSIWATLAFAKVNVRARVSLPLGAKIQSDRSRSGGVATRLKSACQVALKLAAPNAQCT